MRSRTILPCFQQVNLTWARDPIGKPTLGQRSTSQKHVNSMSCKLEPAIWSRDTGQRITCFDRCHLIIAGMSNIKEVHGRLCQPIFWSLAAMLRDSVVVVVVVVVRTRPRAIPLAMITIRKILHGFPFLSYDAYGAPLGGPSGRRSSAKNRCM